MELRGVLRRLHSGALYHGSNSQNHPEKEFYREKTCASRSWQLVACNCAFQPYSR